MSDVDQVDWERVFVEHPEDVKVFFDQMFRAIVDDVKSKIDPLLNTKEKEAFEILDDAEVEKLINQKTKERDKLSPNAIRNITKKAVLSLVLRASLPNYSITTEGDPVVFFNTHVKSRMQYFGLPISALNEALPNLSRTLKSHQRSSEISV